jgi:hypothetical protein
VVVLRGFIGWYNLGLEVQGLGELEDALSPLVATFHVPFFWNTMGLQELLSGHKDLQCSFSKFTKNVAKYENKTTFWKEADLSLETLLAGIIDGKVELPEKTISLIYFYTIFF